MPKGRCNKGSARTMFERAILAVESETGVEWERMLSRKRGGHAAGAARSLAMAVSVAAGIPVFLVGRMFCRSWATVDEARAETLARCLVDQAERDRFIRILYQVLGK